MRVRDVMSFPVMSVRSDAALADAIDLMVQHKISGLPVVDNTGELCGILSESDLLRRIELGTALCRHKWWLALFATTSPAKTYRHANGRRVCDVMTWKVVTIRSTDTLVDAARMMTQANVKRLPVVDDADLVGILSRSDFVKALRRFLSQSDDAVVSDDEIRQRILDEIARREWSSDCACTVAVDRGRVTLRGLVPSEDQRAAVRVAAESVVGVRAVRNEIEVLEPAAIYPL